MSEPIIHEYKGKKFKLHLKFLHEGNSSIEERIRRGYRRATPMITKVLIFDLDERYYGSVEARCHPKDNVSREFGKDLAIENAVTYIENMLNELEECFVSALDDFQNDLGAWGDETFKNSTPESILDHAKEEFYEVVEALENGVSDEELGLEISDLVILMLQLSHKKRIMLSSSLVTKNRINRKRTWAPCEGGYHKHVEENDE